MDCCKVSTLLLIFLFFNFGSSEINKNELEQLCEERELEEESTSLQCYSNIYFCDELVNDDFLYDDYLENGLEEVEYECLVYDDNDRLIQSYKAVYNLMYAQHYGKTPFSAKSINQSESIFIYANISGSTEMSCIYAKKYYFVEIAESTGGCEKTITDALRNEEYVEKYLACDEDYYLECTDKNETTHWDNITWYRDCEPMNGSLPLKITSGDFAYSFFSCATQCKNKLAWIRHYKIYFQETNDVTFSVTSSSPSVQSHSGTEATLSCEGEGGLIDNVRWVNDRNELLCASMHVEEKSSDERFSCSWYVMSSQTSQQNGTTICNKKRKFVTTLHILNVKESDFGKFTCVMKTSSGERNTTIFLQDSSSVKLMRTKFNFLSAFLPAVAGLLCITFILFSLLWHFFRADILLLRKKYFAEYEKGSRRFNVFLSYSLSRDGETEVKELLHELHRWFDLKGYSVFDQHTSHAGDLQYKLAQAAVSDCHRMVIILNPPYLNNEDKIFVSQTGITGSIKGSTKLIFIILPGFQQLIRERVREEDPVCMTLRMAMKQKNSSVIYWKDAKEKNFLKELEVAMPKLNDSSLAQSNYSHDLEKKCDLNNTKEKFVDMSSVTSFAMEKKLPMII